MQVTPINNNTSFNGGRGKSFNRYTNRLNNLRIDAIHKSTPEGQLVNTQELQKVNDIVDKINSYADSFMSKLHPKTELVYEKGVSFAIQNPIGKCYFVLCKVTDGKIDESGKIYLIGEKLPQSLETLEQFAKDLSEKVNAKEVEKTIFENAISTIKINANNEVFWLDRLLVKLHINKTFKYKDKTGVESEITKESLLKDVNQRFFDHKIARHNAKEVERVAKQNKKTADSYKL